MTVDQKHMVRFNAGDKTGSTRTGYSPDAVGINALAGAYAAASQWSSVPIQMAVDPSNCMDVPGLGRANGTKVHTWKCMYGAANQSWRYQPDTQQMIDKNSGKCLDLPGGRAVNGNQLHIWSCDPRNKNQKWEILSDGVIRKPGTTKCVDNAAASTANGAKVQLWDCHSGKNQRWLTGSRPQQPTLRPPTHNEPSDWGVAEVLVFDGNLNAAQIQSVEAYLKDKYGM
jgi:hypothetical protein